MEGDRTNDMSFFTTTSALEALNTAGVTFTGWERNRSHVGLEFQGRRFQIHRTYLLMTCFQQPDEELLEILEDYDTGR